MTTPILVTRSWEEALKIASVVAIDARNRDRFVNEMLSPLVVEAMRYGVDPAVILAQSIHETGWGEFGGVVLPHFHNTCGLKTGSGGGNYDPDAHQRFPNWQAGARAHAQHLCAYAGRKHDDLELTPRAYLVREANKYHGVADTVEKLGGRWAPSSSYGERIADKTHDILRKAGLE